MFLINRMIYRFSQRVRLIRLLVVVLIAIFLFSGVAIHSAAGEAHGFDPSLTSNGLTPVNDMSASADYLGEKGGLYGNGMNSLSSADPHWIKANQAALLIQPRNSLGEVDEFSGNQKVADLLVDFFTADQLASDLFLPVSGSIPIKDCSISSVGLTPLNDMSASEDYFGEAGGLYGNGMNSLPPTDLHWVKASQATLLIGPRNASGKIDDLNGKIGMISIGMSNARYEFDTFMDIAGEEKSDAVVLVNGAQPGMVASEWADADPDSDPWKFLAEAIRDKGLTPNQIQVVWLKQANAAPQPGVDDFPVYAQQLRDDTAVIVKRVKELYPNVQLVYLSSRVYAGYSLAPLSPEPFAYEGAFSVRWLIEDQINGGGATGTTYQNAPVLMWGPYLWADGINPRSDGLDWICADFVDDGVHPSDSGKLKVANMLLSFLSRDKLTRSWFLPIHYHYLPVVHN